MRLNYRFTNNGRLKKLFWTENNLICVIYFLILKVICTCKTIQTGHLTLFLNSCNFKRREFKGKRLLEFVTVKSIKLLCEMSDIVPLNFRKYGTSMLGKAQIYMSRGYTVIDNKFDRLIMQMRIARTKENGNLDKETVNQITLDIECRKRSTYHYKAILWISGLCSIQFT